MRKKRPQTRRRTRNIKRTQTDPIPDRRAMDKTMADIVRLLESQEFDSLDEANAYLQKVLASGQPMPSPAARTPLDEAQERMYEAFEASGKRRVQLAKEALAISEDCADAYVLLAEESARSLAEARDLYAAGVKAGERALGEALFEEAVGHFWGVVETRPYMRARAGLANCLWQLGQRQEAIDHYQEMLRLNPGDNQGIRYILLTCYLTEGMDAEAERLLGEYDDDASATWLYHGALLRYRQAKTGEEANSQLAEALDYNPHVPAYLLGRKRLPRQLPPYVGFGDKNEAAAYVAEAAHLWAQEEGALDWLRRMST